MTSDPINWTQLANQFGIPVVVMVVMGFAIWRVGKSILAWAAPNVQKAVDSYIKTNEQNAESASKSADALEKLVPICEASKKMIETIEDGHEATEKKVAEIHELVPEIHKIVQDLKNELK